MHPNVPIGRFLIVAGILMVLAGFVFMYMDRIPWIGRLPGDINIHGRGWSFHFPVVTGIVISIVLSVILNLFFRR